MKHSYRGGGPLHSALFHLRWLVDCVYIFLCFCVHMPASMPVRVSARVCTPVYACAHFSVHMHSHVCYLRMCVCLSVYVLGYSAESALVLSGRHCQPGCGLPQLHKHWSQLSPQAGWSSLWPRG